jgi:signal transduction histidine kinase
MEADKKEQSTHKENIYSIIAHDLRSPFSTILGYCELLSQSIRRKELEKSLQYCQVIHDAADQAMDFLVKLLDWGRTQVGEISFNPENFRVEILIKEIVPLVNLQAESKQISVKTAVEPGLTVFADRNMFRTILINLISNAVKFSKTGGQVSISCRKVKDGVEFIVADKGIGIEPDKVMKLFNSDTPFTTKGTYLEQGTGLGLLLCKKFVDLHQGKIWANSEPGKGSRFIFRIPNAG